MGTGFKHANIKVSYDGLSFASKLEAALYEQLSWRMLDNEIKDIKCQDSIYLTEARILYKPDFKYTIVKTGETEWAEAKGFETDIWRIKRRLWMFYGPGPLHIFKGSRTRLVLDETIIPKDS